ncbi:MAG: hypothetical protein Q9207_007309 [Kuettlingeria erythrocarpa]
MPSGTLAEVSATTDVERIEAPITWKAYLMCAFAAFGGIFFGYDSGYINGVKSMPYFIRQQTGLQYPTNDDEEKAFVLESWRDSLITSILSAGTFFGAIIAGDLADFIGRRLTIISGCAIFIIGVILQTASAGLGLIVAGRLIAGFGVGFVSAIIILYMSECSPKKIRGAIVSGYQFAITIGLLLASCVDYGTQDRDDTGSYRIPIALQMLWALFLAAGIAYLPESPRYLVKRGKLDQAAVVLSRLRSQPIESHYVQHELAEIVANHEYELRVVPQGSYWSSWANCFQGSLFKPSSNLRRTILGTSMQMMQQWTGVNFVFYFGTSFFTQLGTISNPFLISLITTLVNVCSTPISFWTIERFGRRPLLIWGALGMLVCEFLVAIMGTADGDNPATVRAMIAFICIYIFFFASTWGPGAWVVIGEIFPLPIRSRGVGLSTASNWLWNCIITVITPYLVGPDKGNLGAKVFFLWGALCTACFVYAYLLVPETKGLSLEQVDKMLEETTPRNSARWVPHSTFAGEMGVTEKGTLAPEILEEVERKGSVNEDQTSKSQLHASLQSSANWDGIYQLYVHPIKSLRPIPLTSADLTPTGIANDRRYMLFKRNPSASDPWKRLQRMTVTFFAELGLFTQALSESNDGHFTVTYNPPPGGRKGGGREKKHLEMAFDPDTEGLEEMEVDLHGSKTKALDMGPGVNGWFTDCFGWEVLCVYMPEGTTRQVLGNLSPNAVANGTKPGNSNSWFSTLAAYVSESLKGKHDEGLTFADCAPYLVVTQESVKDVSSRLPDGAEMDVTKFRPNIVLEGADEAYEEDYWGAICIRPSTTIDEEPADGNSGGMEILLTQNCLRCQSLNIDYTNGVFAKDEVGMVLKKLMKDRRVDAGKKYSPVFGRYGFLGGDGNETGGRVRVGDEVTNRAWFADSE